jgi:hypothetical protein
MGWRIIEDRRKTLNKGSDGRGNRKSVGGIEMREDGA